MEVANLFYMSLVSHCEQKLFRLYHRKAVTDAFNVQNISKVFFFCVLQCSFKIFMTVFTFLCVKANFKEIGEEILFPYFFNRKMLMSAFLLRFKANYLTKCVATPIIFSFWIPTAFAKIYFFCAWFQFDAKMSIFSGHRL